MSLFRWQFEFYLHSSADTTPGEMTPIQSYHHRPVDLWPGGGGGGQGG